MKYSKSSTLRPEYINTTHSDTTLVHHKAFKKTEELAMVHMSPLCVPFKNSVWQIIVL